MRKEEFFGGKKGIDDLSLLCLGQKTNLGGGLSPSFPELVGGGKPPFLIFLENNAKKKIPVLSSCVFPSLLPLCAKREFGLGLNKKT